MPDITLCANGKGHCKMHWTCVRGMEHWNEKTLSVRQSFAYFWSDNHTCEYYIDIFHPRNRAVASRMRQSQWRRVD